MQVVKENAEPEEFQIIISSLKCQMYEGNIDYVHCNGHQSDLKLSLRKCHISGDAEYESIDNNKS